MRVTVNNASLPDLIFVNNSHGIVNSGVSHLAPSDNIATVLYLRSMGSKAPSRIIEHRSYKYHDEEGSLQDLAIEYANYSLIGWRNKGFFCSVVGKDI